MSKNLFVGDIHTKTWIIESVRKLIDNYDFITFCGDYADNWNTSPLFSLEAWKALKAFQDEYPTKVGIVIGNHDYAYIRSDVAGRSSGFNWTTQTLLNAPENRELKDWLSSRPVSIEVDGYTASHAGYVEEFKETDDLWSDLSPIWVRPDYPVRYIKKQIIGHTPQTTCKEKFKDVWFIDTFSEYQDNTPIGDHTALEMDYDGVTGETVFGKVHIDGYKQTKRISEEEG
jgi:hypothetical protein